jgi:hypothetical protein
MTTATASRTASHYLVREFANYGGQRSVSYPLDTMQDALEMRDMFTHTDGTVTIAYVVFTDGTEQVIA